MSDANNTLTMLAITRGQARNELFPILIIYIGAFAIRGVEPVGEILADLGPLGPSIPLLAVTLGMLIWVRMRTGGWSLVGLHFPLSLKMLALIAVGALLARQGLAQFTDIIFQSVGVEGPDTARFEGRMALPELFILLSGMWLVGAFAEEAMHRGFIFPRLAALLGDTHASWLIAMLIGAAFFGMGHAYQGPAGIISTGGGAIIYSLTFLVSRKSIWPGVVAHGVSNTIGLMAATGWL